MATKKKKTAKNYDAIAKKKIRKPSESSRGKKILVYSRNKKGKSTFGLSAGNVVVADPEFGMDAFIATNPDVWDTETWEDIVDYYGFLRSGKHDYEYAFVDGMTRIHNMALRKVMKLSEDVDLDRIPGLVRRQDYNKAGELTKELLYKFLKLPMGVIFSAQERMITVADEDDEEDAAAVQFVPDLPAGVRGAINGIVDVIGRLYVVRVKARVKGTKQVKEVLQRRLWIGVHDQYDTGYRSEFGPLPDYIKNPTVPKLVNLLNTGKES